MTVARSCHLFVQVKHVEASCDASDCATCIAQTDWSGDSCSFCATTGECTASEFADCVDKDLNSDGGWNRDSCDLQCPGNPGCPPPPPPQPEPEGSNGSGGGDPMAAIEDALPDFCMMSSDEASNAIQCCMSIPSPTGSGCTTQLKAGIALNLCSEPANIDMGISVSGNGVPTSLPLCAAPKVDSCDLKAGEECPLGDAAKSVGLDRCDAHPGVVEWGKGYASGQKNHDPIPGFAYGVDVPMIGQLEAGLYVDVDIEGDLGGLSISIAIDMCASGSVAGISKEVCGGELPGLSDVLPFNILDLSGDNKLILTDFL
jgi:hypothetical protein